jgi:hypothetical protein
MLQISTIAASIAFAACAGNGDGLDAGGRPVGDGSGGGPLTADFASIQQHVFTPICTACHAGANAPQGLRLDSANSYDLLVGIPSNEASSIQRVKPGDPDHSYLIQKLEGRASVGARMPFGGPYLDQATIDVIRQWITDGAQRSSTAAAKPGLAVASTSPATNDVLIESPARLVVGFTQELDRSRLDAGSFQLTRVQADPAGKPIAAIDVTVGSIDANPNVLILTPRAPLTPGRYALRVRNEAITGPSGDALPGGGTSESTLMTFTIGMKP